MLGAMDAARLIRDVRRRRGLTQAELARRAGTSQPVVSAYEHGHRDPSVTTLRRLIEASGERLRVDSIAATSDLPPA
jgi:transcriptional regulator with XRE-family HTH domain